MIALQFGAGNIGRGFIGALLNQANYEIYFLDVNENLISELNKRGSYIIELASEKKKQSPSQVSKELTVQNKLTKLSISFAKLT